jgi:hypothetical protein
VGTRAEATISSAISSGPSIRHNEKQLKEFHLCSQRELQSALRTLHQSFSLPLLIKLQESLSLSHIAVAPVSFYAFSFVNFLVAFKNTILNKIHRIILEANLKKTLQVIRRCNRSERLTLLKYELGSAFVASIYPKQLSCPRR